MGIKTMQKKPLANDYYVHGYTERESQRLYDQSQTLARLLHEGTYYPAQSTVLEIGCGTGAQTIHLARNSPHAEIIAVDISDEYLTKAAKLFKKEHITNVVLDKADIYKLRYKKDFFDHIFICFLLEHLPDPQQALRNAKKILKKNGTITVIEGDHGSCYYYPQSPDAERVWNCLIEAQARLGGNSLIGRELYPLLIETGFTNVDVKPKMVYVDASKPHLVEGFTKKTIIAMLKGIKTKALSCKLIDKKSWNKGMRNFYRMTEPDGVFCYTFFKGIARK